MDDRTYRLNRLNAVATMMDLLGFTVAKASDVRDRLSSEDMQALRVAGVHPIRTEAKRMALSAVAHVL
jgi:hypothetical protein